MKAVVENNVVHEGGDNRKYNMRKEALRDLTLFVEGNIVPEQLYSFFRVLADSPIRSGER